MVKKYIKRRGENIISLLKILTFFRTFIVGYGMPTNERFSNEAIVIISSSFGIPLLILSLLFVCTYMRRKSEDNHGSRIPHSILR